ncbi:MAG TPA: hypothetical protein VMS98_14935 [Thermoanaerobaculia bacterium]|nr:hypothetical protein [Thermoanaerobaculia bacterium]
MRIRSLVSAVILFLSVFPAAAQQPSADDTARRAIDVLAGPAWEKARYFAFTFNVERDGKIAASFPQRWDRYTGQYRVTGRNQQGQEYVVVMNVNDRSGKAWLDGAEVADPKDLLTTGYRRFINDTYWLLMPLKSMDPGVKREATGARTDECGRAHDVVKLSFDQGVGLTPGDMYWMWVNRDTGLVDQWHMKLQNMKPEEEPSVVLFHDYRRFGGLLISTKREIKGRPQRILLDDVVVSSDVPVNAFGPR